MTKTKEAKPKEVKGASHLIKEIILRGSPEEKKALYSFDSQTTPEKIKKKFNLFSRASYPRYFKLESAPFHDDYVDDMIKSYYGKNKLIAGFRGCSKTSLSKLFVTFVLLFDKDNHKKYIKILSRDMKNSKQFVTDVYNLMIEVKEWYGNPFENYTGTKREETMGSFTMNTKVKITAGTVGQSQRGHVQDANRPDWLLFDDVEDKETIRSMVMTQGIIDRCGEAIDGLSTNGSYLVLGNYISDQGTIQWFIGKESVKERLTPIMLDENDYKTATWPAAYPPVKIEAIKNDSDDFFGEYMCDPQKSQDKFFDFERVRKDIQRSQAPLVEAAGVKYWANYKPNHRYGMGSDHSFGVGLDSNTMALFDFSTGELVATHASNNISPDLAVYEYVRVGREFGNCIYAPENNHQCGRTAIATLKTLEYPNILKQVDESKARKTVSASLGWSTNSNTKYIMFHEFRTDYNEGLIRIYDVNVLKEMKAYSNNDLADRTAGLITRHFDLLTAVVIAWQMRKYSQIKKKKINLPSTTNKRAINMVTGKPHKRINLR